MDGRFISSGVVLRPLVKSGAVEPSLKPFIAGLLCCGLFALLGSAFLRGISLDELWQLWLSDPSVGIGTAWAQRWKPDPHPPLFNLAIWFADPLLPNEIHLRRLAANIVPLILYGASALAVMKSGRGGRAFGALFTVMLLSGVDATTYFAQLRSYFSAIMMAGTTLLLWRHTITQEKDFRGREDIPVAALVALNLIVSLQLHFVGSFIQGLMGLGWAVTLARRRRYRWCAIVLAGSAPACLLICCFFIIQSAEWKTAIDYLWITTTPLASAGIVARIVLSAVIMFPVVTYVAFRRRGEPSSTADFRTAILAVLLLSAAILMTINVFRPMLIGRYLIAYQPLIYALLADLAGSSIFLRRRLKVALGINVAALAAISLAVQSRAAEWDATTDHVAEAVQACPATRVYAMDPWFLRDGGASNFARREGVVFAWGHRKLGRDHGFPVTILHPGDRLPFPILDKCPTLLWIEHYRRQQAETGNPAVIVRKAGIKTAEGRTPRLIDAFFSPRGMVLSIARPLDLTTSQPEPCTSVTSPLTLRDSPSIAPPCSRAGGRHSS
jgi:hypothetical protein